MPTAQLTVLSVSQNYYLRGGSDRVFFETNRLLSGRGHRVIPFTAADLRNQAPVGPIYLAPAADFEKPGLRDFGNYIYSPAARRVTETIIQAEHPDLAHLHIYYGKLTASILAPLKAAGIPIVQTLHEYKLICPVYTLVSNGQICEACQGHSFWQALPRRCNRGSLARTALSVAESYVSRWLGALDKIDHFIAISHFQRQKMISLGVPPEKITTIYNLVDISAFSPGSRDEGYFLYFGRVERLKGVFTLLEAFAPLTHLRLKIVGEGAALAEVRQKIAENGWTHIETTGFQSGSQLADSIAASRAVIVPSEWYEPFGLTVIEALACARPVIAANIGGIPELIQPQADGLLFPPGNPDLLREHILSLAADPERARGMGLAGRARVEAQFSPERYLDQLLSVYHSVRDR